MLHFIPSQLVYLCDVTRIQFSSIVLQVLLPYIRNAAESNFRKDIENYQLPFPYIVLYLILNHYRRYYNFYFRSNILCYI